MKPTRANGGEHAFRIALGLLDVWFFRGRHNFSSLSLISTFSLYCFSRSFSRRFPANSMCYFCCGRLWGPKLVFHWPPAWPCWQPLWWGVISFQNFRSLKLGLYFLASSELIGYVNLRIIMKFGQNVPWLSMWKRVWDFFDIPNTSPFERSHVTKIVKYSIRQLQNRFSRQPIGMTKKPNTLL